MKLPLITAHSGCEQTPQDSLDSIYRGIELGADAVEMDVRMDPSGILRISHNAEPDAAIYATRATLQQVFDLLRPTSLLLNLDVKEALHLPAILDLARQNRFEKERLILSGALSPGQLLDAPQLGNRSQIFLNLEEILKYLFVPQLDLGEADGFSRLMRTPWNYLRPRMESLSTYLPHIVHICKALPIAGLNGPYWCLDEAAFQQLAQAGISVSVWTVDSVEEQCRIFRQGAGTLCNLTTRQVASARRQRQEIFSF